MQTFFRRAAGAVSFALAATAFCAPAAAQSNDLQTIVDQKVVRVGAIEAPPWYHQDLATGKWTGIVPEVAELVFGNVGIKVEYVPTEWGSAVAGLQSRKFDIVGAYTATPARALAIDFSVPVGTIPTGFVSLKKLPVKTWADLNKPAMRIAAIDGAATTRSVQAMMPNAKWALVKTNDAMLLELESGRADIAISNQPTLLQYVESRKRGTITLPTPLRGTTAPFGMRKTTGHELRDWLDVSLEYAKSEESIQKIWDKYLPK